MTRQDRIRDRRVRNVWHAGRAGPVPVALGADGRCRDLTTGLVLHDQPLLVDLIELTLNHGLFVVRRAATMAEAVEITSGWRPNLGIVDMEHDESEALLSRLGASSSLTGSPTPVLGLTRQGNLQTKLRAFGLGVDDILTVPFSPEELLARSIVVSRADGSSRGSRSSTRSGAPTSWPRATSWTAASDPSGSSSRTTAATHRFATVPGHGYRFIPTFTNLGWAADQAPRGSRAT